MVANQEIRSSRKLVWWMARVWSLPAIFFVGAHLFEPDAGPGLEEGWLSWVTVGTLFVSVFGLVLAWWKARPGGWMALVALGLCLILYWADRGEFFPLEGLALFVAGIVVPAVLFLWSGRPQST